MRNSPTAARPARRGDLERRFAITGGSVIGREHRRIGQNNQDAFAWLAQPDLLCGVVCDGCGSSPRSEIGASLGAAWTVGAIRRVHAAGSSAASPEFWRAVQRRLLTTLGRLARSLTGRGTPIHTTAAGLGAIPRRDIDGLDLGVVVHERLLFTIIGFVVTAHAAVTFASGDGLVVVNTRRRELGPFPGNRPPYLAYALTGEAAPRLGIVDAIDTGSLDHIIVASDGAAELPPDELATFANDHSFRNAHAVERRLRQLNRPTVRPNWAARRLEHEHGRLADDTTVVVLRRRPAEA